MIVFGNVRRLNMSHKDDYEIAVENFWVDIRKADARFRTRVRRDTGEHCFKELRALCEEDLMAHEALLVSCRAGQHIEAVLPAPSN